MLENSTICKTLIIFWLFILVFLPTSEAQQSSQYYTTGESITYEIPESYTPVYAFFSNDHQRFILFVEMKDKKMRVILDGKEQPIYETVGSFRGDFNISSIKPFSEDGKYYAYTVSNEKASSGDKITLDTLVLGPAARILRTPYSQGFVNLNGKEGNKYKSVYNLTFAPKDNELVYIGVGNQVYEYYIVSSRIYNDKIVETRNGPFSLVYDYSFSGNGEWFGYIAAKEIGTEPIIFLNGRQKWVQIKVPWQVVQEKLNDFKIYPDKIALSSDGSILVILCTAESMKRIITLKIDTETEKDTLNLKILEDGIIRDYEWIRDPLFSKDGRYYSYVAKNQGKFFLVVFDRKQEGLWKSPSYDNIIFPTFHSKSAEVIFIAQSGGKYFLVIGGKEGLRYDYIGSPIFSYDGLNLACIAKKDNKYFVLVAGKEVSKTYDYIWNISFSPDGKKIVFNAKQNRKILLVCEELK